MFTITKKDIEPIGYKIKIETDKLVWKYIDGIVGSRAHNEVWNTCWFTIFVRIRDQVYIQIYDYYDGKRY